MSHQNNQSAAPQEEMKPLTEAQVSELFEKIMIDGQSIKQIANLPEGWMDNVYKLGYDLYSNGRYVDAENAFFILSMMDTYNRTYWIALGGARQMQKKYDEASKAYAMASVLDHADPIPHLRSAECYIALGDTSKAGLALFSAIHFADPNSDEGKKAKMLLTAVEKQSHK
jgi:type III secretion system low calcium response chaperone LcrH/SycD